MTSLEGPFTESNLAIPALLLGKRIGQKGWRSLGSRYFRALPRAGEFIVLDKEIPPPVFRVVAVAYPDELVENACDLFVVEVADNLAFMMDPEKFANACHANPPAQP